MALGADRGTSMLGSMSDTTNAEAGWCAICNNNVENLREHFEKEHQPPIKSKKGT